MCMCRKASVVELLVETGADMYGQEQLCDSGNVSGRPREDHDGWLQQPRRTTTRVRTAA